MVASGKYPTFKAIAEELGVENSSLSRFLQKTFQDWREERVMYVDWHIERLKREYEKLAYFDVSDLFDEHGKLLPLSKMSESAKAVIAGIETFEEWDGKGEDRTLSGHVRKIKIASRKDALDSIAKILGVFSDKVQHSGEVTVRVEYDDQDPAAASGPE